GRLWIRGGHECPLNASCGRHAAAVRNGSGNTGRTRCSVIRTSIAPGCNEIERSLVAFQRGPRLALSLPLADELGRDSQLARGEAASVSARGIAAIHKMLLAGFLGASTPSVLPEPIEAV